MLHGTFGEDGTVQGLLELADLAYVGAGVMASAVSMDKEMMKRICIERSLPVVEYVALGRNDLDAEAIAKLFAFPVFVKPANLGSSVGISKVHTQAELEPALRLAAEYDRKIIVERSIEGRELECAVLGNDDPKASLPCEILPSRNSTITTINTCWIRPKPSYPRIYLRTRPRGCGAWRWNVIARSNAKVWRGSISCWSPLPASST